MNPRDGDQLEQQRRRLEATCPYLGRPCPQDSSQCRKWITLQVAVVHGPGNLSLPRPHIQMVSVCEDDHVVGLLQSLNANLMQLIQMTAEHIGAKGQMTHFMPAR